MKRISIIYRSLGRVGFAFLLLISNFALAQPPSVLWSRTFGSNEDEYYTTISEVDGGEFVLCYMSYDIRNSFDVLVRKLSSAGDQVWDLQLGGTDGELDPQIVSWGSGESLVAVLGRSYLNDTCIPLWVIRVDSSGDTLWTRLFCPYYESRPLAVCRQSNGNFVVCLSRNTSPGSREGFGLLFVSPEGDSLDFRNFPNVEDETLRDPLGIIVTQTDGIGVFGIGSDYNHVPPRYWPNPFLLLLDADGDSLWERVWTAPHFLESVST